MCLAGSGLRAGGRGCKKTCVNVLRQTPIYGIVYLDALYVKMRHEGRVENRAVYMALGVDLAGKKDVLGLWTSANEGSKFRLSALTAAGTAIALGEGRRFQYVSTQDMTVRTHDLIYDTGQD